MLVKPSGPPPDAVVQGAAPAPHRGWRNNQAEDDLLAFLLISTWMLITGRTLRSDVPPGQLSESELIEFWADGAAAGGAGPGTQEPGPPR